MLWLLFRMKLTCGPANRRDGEKKNSDNICYVISFFLIFKKILYSKLILNA